MPERKNYLTRLWRRVADQIVQETPKGSELCAFDCRKGQCTQEEWETCQRRLRNAAGELMPADEEIRKEQTKPESSEAEFAGVAEIYEQTEDSHL